LDKLTAVYKLTIAVVVHAVGNSAELGSGISSFQRNILQVLGIVLGATMVFQP
jgi:hypothetical protein